MTLASKVSRDTGISINTILRRAVTIKPHGEPIHVNEFETRYDDFWVVADEVIRQKQRSAAIESAASATEFVVPKPVTKKPISADIKLFESVLKNKASSLGFSRCVIKGVYLLFRAGCIAYVGSSINILQRLDQHINHDVVKRNSDGCVSLYSVVAFEINDYDAMLTIERSLIAWLNPPFNIHKQRNTTIRFKNLEDCLTDRSYSPRLGELERYTHINRTKIMQRMETTKEHIEDALYRIQHSDTLATETINGLPVYRQSEFHHHNERR